MKAYPYADRLIVAADFVPVTKFPVVEVRAKVMSLAEQLEGLGVGLKLNSGLRVMGYDVLRDITSLGLHGFADLKIVDIEETMATDGKFLAHYQPRYLTVMCNAGAVAIRAIAKELPSTRVIGVTVPTNWDEATCQGVYGCSIQEAVIRLAGIAADADLRDIVLAAKENQAVLKYGILEGDKFKHLCCNNPAIRPEWGRVKRDDQDPKRVSTVTGALQAGAQRLIVGRPILTAVKNNEGLPQSPREAVIRILEEIHQFVVEDKTS
ncbi:MAG: orotidine 5'-phosphate decarboxylase / HUMPS family protein [Candidatus Moraniibacteriota bacterium]